MAANNKTARDDLESELGAMKAVYTALEPLSERLRQRVLDWARERLSLEDEVDEGDEVDEVDEGDEVDEVDEGDEVDEDELDPWPESFSASGRAWLRRAGLSIADIKKVFDFDFYKEQEEVEYVFDGRLLGDTKTARLRHSYLLVGAAHCLLLGEETFPDAEARDLCRKQNCYDATNHASYLKKMSHLFSGDKTRGYMLTGAGKLETLELLKVLTG